MMIGSQLNAAVHRLQVLQHEQFDAWTAWAASLVTPGAGHLLALKWSAVCWLLADAVVLKLAETSSVAAGGHTPVWFAVAWVVMGLVSGEQARTTWVRNFGFSAGRVKSRVACRLPRGSALAVTLTIDLPLAADEVWRCVADVNAFQAVDPFHAGITSSTGTWSGGAELTIEHRAFGMRWVRTGRLLNWREGRGYAFSDLSARGRRCGFPHVFFIDVDACEPRRTRLSVAVRGRWTCRCVPRWLGMVWTYLIMSQHARLLRVAFS